MGTKFSITANKQFLILIIFFITLSLFSTIFVLKGRWTITLSLSNVIIKSEDITPPRVKRNIILGEEFKEEKIHIGLVNINEGDEEVIGRWEELGSNTSLVHFDKVSEKLEWRELVPEWNDEEEKWVSSKCSNIPMPKFEDYGAFDVIISKVSCGIEGKENEGIRDLYRLQVNLVVANLVVRNGYNGNERDTNRSVYVVFIGSCGPMWELFRCDDLLSHEGEIWIYKPNLRRLREKVLMFNGDCKISPPLLKQGELNNGHNFLKLANTIDQPRRREAYVTVLHSSEEYVCGAIVLAHSIAKTNSTKDLVLLHDDSISLKSRQALESVGWKLKLIERIESPFAKKDAYNKWNYSKLRIWQLTEYDKVIFIDSDLIILRNIDKFFRHPQLSAVGDKKYFFNSGVILIEPSTCIFETLMEKRHTLHSYNGGDQGFLNEAFTWWNRWPSPLNYYKMTHHSKQLEDNSALQSIYAIHYFGFKPWMCYRDYDCNWDTDDRRKFVSDFAHKVWWKVHDEMPKKLQKFCDLSVSMDLNLKRLRRKAKNESYPDEHWKIEVKDPRQH